jgi:excinuclease ABC subunit A
MKNKENITIKGARVHNLKNIDLEIPHNQLVVFTGVSGSGKSSLAFDTIFAEGQRRYIESLSPYARQFLGQMKPADVDEIIGLAPSISIGQKALSHNPRSTVGTLTELYDYLRVLYARIGEVYCPKCNRKIQKLSLDEILDIVIDRAKDIGEEYVTILSPVVFDRKGEYYQLLYDYLSLGYSEVRIDGQFYSLHDKVKLAKGKKHTIEIVIDKIMLTDRPRLSEAIENSLNYSEGLVTAMFKEAEKRKSAKPSPAVRGTKAKKDKNSNEVLLSSNWTCPYDDFTFPEVEPRLFSFNSPHGACETCHGIGRHENWVKTSVKDKRTGKVKKKWHRESKECETCEGKRLKDEVLSVRVGKLNIFEVTNLPIDKTYEFFFNYQDKMTKRQKTIASGAIDEILNRLDFLLQVGLSYFTLGRESGTLSGGEAQRIRLSSQIGSHLSHTLYVLDEPTIGLHERDTERLIKTLKALRDQNNSVIVVEHDEKTIEESDYLVDLGPLAGVHGGEVVASGVTQKLLKGTDNGESLTLDYLQGKRKIEVPKKRRDGDTEKLQVIGARANNLKNLQVDIPLRKLVGITGVSGSGKSSFLYNSLYKNMQEIKSSRGNPKLENISKIRGSEYVTKVVMINQSPIGRTPRSNPATYTGILTPIRNFFSMLPEARERGFTLSRFSFNRPGGRCESCQGAGFNTVEMHFLPTVEVECDVCHGKRFNKETLEVEFKGKNIADVLALTVNQAAEFFKDIWQIADKLKVLQEVGLGYLQLGQSATTLSGGEAQRIKLAKELTHVLGKKTLYLLDEPTVGLHYKDIEMLLEVLNKLVERQNTVLVIEHNLHMIKSFDYVIDLGPEGGDLGGKVVAKGTPEEIANNSKSVTGKYLRDYL